MDEQQYELMRTHILDMIDDHAGNDGTIALRDVVDAAQERYATHPLFPRGRPATTAPSPRPTSKPAARSTASPAAAPNASPTTGVPVNTPTAPRSASTSE